MSELLPEGLNGVVHGRGAIVALHPVPADTVDYGAPRQGEVELGSLGTVKAGIWELRDGAVYDTEVDELFIVISGAATIKLLDENRSVDVRTGDVMRLTAGTKTRWIVRDHIRKVYLATD